MDDFVKNDTLFEYQCSPSLTKFERKQIHQLATTANLLHVSEGEGRKRRIVLKKIAPAKPLTDITNTEVNAPASLSFMFIII